jgi:hypothetical protein
MKHALFFLILVIILNSCGNNKTPKQELVYSKDTITLDEKATTSDISGKWYYTEYTDSTIKYKKNL